MSICPFCKKEISGKTAGGHVAQCRRKTIPYKCHVITKAKCVFCNKDITKSRLEKHKINCEKRHMSCKVIHEKDKFTCTICNKEFKKQKATLFHYWIMHTEEGKNFRLNKKVINQNRVHKKTGKIWNKGLTKTSDPRIQTIANTISQRILSGENQPSFKGKKHTEEIRTILSQKRKNWLSKNKDKHNWKYKGESYPEKIFRLWLIEQKIEFVAEYTPENFDRFFALDFAIVKSKIGFEINGEQHYNRNGEFTPYHIERQKYIESKGWYIVNIKAYDVVKKFNQVKIYVLKLLENIIEKNI